MRAVLPGWELHHLLMLWRARQVADAAWATCLHRVGPGAGPPGPSPRPDGRGAQKKGRIGRCGLSVYCIRGPAPPGAYFSDTLSFRMRGVRNTSSSVRLRTLALFLNR